jgi:hypothetical protein
MVSLQYYVLQIVDLTQLLALAVRVESTSA